MSGERSGERVEELTHDEQSCKSTSRRNVEILKKNPFLNSRPARLKPMYFLKIAVHRLSAWLSATLVSSCIRAVLRSKHVRKKQNRAIMATEGVPHPGAAKPYV